MKGLLAKGGATVLGLAFLAGVIGVIWGAFHLLGVVTLLVVGTKVGFYAVLGLLWLLLITLACTAAVFAYLVVRVVLKAGYSIGHEFLIPTYRGVRCILRGEPVPPIKFS